MMHNCAHVPLHATLCEAKDLDSSGVGMVRGTLKKHVLVTVEMDVIDRGGVRARGDRRVEGLRRLPTRNARCCGGAWAIAFCSCDTTIADTCTLELLEHNRASNLNFLCRVLNHEFDVTLEAVAKLLTALKLLHYSYGQLEPQISTRSLAIIVRP
jgi:hypothetical protein